MFWASHAAWAARAVRDLQGAIAAGLGTGSLRLGPAYFADTELARLEAGGLVAFVRGARPPGNVNHGSVHGAGLLRLVGALGPRDEVGDDSLELLPRCRFGGAQLAEWTGKAGGLRLAQAWRGGKDELRFALWTLRVHWRAGRRLDALLELPRVFRRAILAFAYPRISSAFARDVRLERVSPNEVVVRGALAWRDGVAVPECHFERRFRMLPDGVLEVDESLEAGPRPRGLAYRLPEGAESLVDSGPGPRRQIRWRLGAPPR